MEGGALMASWTLTFLLFMVVGAVLWGLAKEK